MHYLTGTNIAVYRFVEQYIHECGYAPTLREIGAACYLTVAGAMFNLEKLNRLGYIRRQPYVARAVRILKPLPETPNTTEALYRFIALRISEGAAPTQYEMAKAFKVSDQTVRNRLKQLEMQGRIKRCKHVARSIVLLRQRVSP